MTTHVLQTIAREIRYQLVLMSRKGKAAHLGSSLSCVDLLVALYWGYLRIDPKNPTAKERDRFILSKGHAITTLYACLAKKGFFEKKILDTFNEDESLLPEHPSANTVAGVEMATGSLGHGLSVGLGQALGGKIQGLKYQVVVLLSDGECNEGAVWEAALFAPAYHLSQVTVIIDFNKWQATGRSEKIMKLNPLKQKWEAFGWHALEINGHNFGEIFQALKSKKQDQPTAIIAHTIKGKGISFMEDDNNWHYKIPNQTEVMQAKAELGIA